MAVSHINTECKRYGCIKNLLACYANCRYSARCDDLRKELEDKTEEAATDINAYLSQQNRPPITVQLQKRGVKFLPLTSVEIKPKSRKLRAGVSKTRSLRSYAVSNSTDSLVRPKKTSSAIERVSRVSSQPVSNGNSVISKAASKNKAVKKRRKSIKRTAAGRASSKKASAASDRKPAGGKSSQTLNRKSPGEIESFVQKPNKPVSRKSSVMRKKATRSKKESDIEKERGSNDAPIAKRATPQKTGATKSTRQRKSGAKTASSRARKDKVFIILEGDNASLVDERGLMEHLLSGSSSKARYFEATEVEAKVQIIPKK